MKIYTYILIAALLSVGSVVSAQSMSEVWRDIPRSVVPTIERNSRLDMIDLYQAGMTARAATMLGDTAQILAMGDSYIAVRTSRASVMQIKRLGKSRKPIYAVVRTVEAPVSHSHVELYNHEWEVIPLDKRVPCIDVEMFVSDTLTGNKRNLLLGNIKLRMLQYIMSEESNDLIILPSFMQALDEATRKELAPYVREAVQLSWKGGKWIQRK